MVCFAFAYSEYGGFILVMDIGVNCALKAFSMSLGAGLAIGRTVSGIYPCTDPTDSSRY